MEHKIIDFVNNEKIGVIAVGLPSGELHAATVHYSFAETPPRFFIKTTSDTQKVQNLLDAKVDKAAMVIGFEENAVTLQMRGIVRIVLKPQELEEVYKTHYEKHPGSEKYKGPDTVFMEFSPNWLRFTDFTSDPENIVESFI